MVTNQDNFFKQLMDLEKLIGQLNNQKINH